MIGVIIAVSLTVGFALGILFDNITEPKKKKKKKGIKCTCSNPQWCDIKCNAKDLFYDDYHFGNM